MQEKRTCPQCGAERSNDSLGGLCPKCLVRFSFVELEGQGASVPPDESLASSLPRQFGDYEVLAEIAHGGMGVVYKARQISLHRTVALKMVAAGHLTSSSAVRRFHTEAEAAANLDHPNIVPIYEIGEHDGQHYFTMKLVEGASLAQRLPEFTLAAADLAEGHKSVVVRRQAHKLAALLAKVADAVHYAHQRGILHRDLKPGNILIDRDGQPHVTDFGLAKRVEADSHLTLSGEIMGTPAYMAPEQAAGNVRQVTTAADVFSLGAMLYQLLTGRMPFAGATPVEMLHAVIHHEPPAPQALNPDVPRDLETICLKCLEKDPGKRYGSARDVAEELGRFVQGEPTQARPVSRVEKVWRWSRRNPALAGFGAATLVLLLTVAVGAPIAVWREARLRRHAEAEASKREQVAQFLKSMLEGVGPSKALGRDTTMLEEILRETAERVGTELKNQPEVEAELRSTLGQVYEALGQYDEAENMHRAALALRQERFGPEHPQVAHSLNALAMALRHQEGKVEEAEATQRAALAMQQRLLPKEHPDLAQSLNDLAIILQDTRDPRKLPEAGTLEQESLAMLRTLLEEDDKRVALALNNLAVLFARQGKWVEAASKQQEALDLQRKLLKPDHPDIAQSLNNLSAMLRYAGDLAKAEEVAREAVELRARVLGSTHEYVGTSLNNLASALWQQMKLEEAETKQREALAIQIGASSPTHPESLNFMNNLATILNDQGKFAEAEEIHRQVLAIRTNVFGPESVPVAGSLDNLARVLRDEGRFAEAEDLHRRALAIQGKLLATNDPVMTFSRMNLGIAQCAQGKFAEAETNQQTALAIRRAVFGEDHSYVAQSLNTLGLLYRKGGKLAEAETNLLQALDICRKLPSHHELLLAATLENLVLLRGDQHRLPEAEAWAGECLAIYQNRLTNNWRMFNAQALRGRTLLAQKHYAEAEPLLLSGCQGMKERRARIPALSQQRYREAVESLIQLYETTQRQGAAADWRKEMTRAVDLDRTKPGWDAQSSARPYGWESRL